MMPSKEMELYEPLTRTIASIEQLRRNVLARVDQAPIFAEGHLHDLGNLLARCGEFEGYLVSLLGDCDTPSMRNP